MKIFNLVPVAVASIWSKGVSYYILPRILFVWNNNVFDSFLKIQILKFEMQIQLLRFIDKND